MSQQFKNDRVPDFGGMLVDIKIEYLTSLCTFNKTITSPTRPMSSFDISYIIAQSDCHQILSRLFCHPVKGVHDDSTLYENLIRTTGLIKPKALGWAKKLRKTAHNINFNELEMEYWRLFETESGALAYPCSYAYLPSLQETDGINPWIEEFYLKTGFNSDNLFYPKDHIASEFSFVSFLLKKISDSFQKDDIHSMNLYSELRCRFIHEHMVGWVNEFTKNILINSKSSYYLQLAIIARTVLISCHEDDLEILKYN